MATSMIRNRFRNAESDSASSQCGFSILELLVAAVLVVVAVLASLHSLQSGFLAYGVANDSRKASIDLWNRSRREKLGESSTLGADLIVLPGARPLRRSILEAGKGASAGLRWEVLRAQK